MPKSHEDFLLMMSITSPNVEVLGHYESAKGKVKVKCKKCQYVWSQRADWLLRGRACPACAGKVVIAGMNDFASACPNLLKDWDFNKNTEVSPYCVTKGSGKKAWWICSKCGYEWQAVIGNRAKGAGCPECKKKTIAEKQQKRHVIEGVTDFISVYPKLNDEWDYDKNTKFNPREYSPGSNTIVWWKCSSCGHEWQTSINHRCNSNRGCPECARKRIGIKHRQRALKDGDNSLATKFPELIKEWDYTKNGNTTPENISPGSDFRAWWKCSTCGYEWNTTVGYRTSGGGCPYCSGKVVWKGHNDLATVCPELCKEWLYSKNSKDPSAFSAGSSIKVWWKCKECGYEYQATINARTTNHTGCSVCSNHKVVIGMNDLQTKAPSLYAEWDYSKNTQDPLTISTGSTKRYWWKCSECGYEWLASVDNRYRGRGCPQCKRALVTQKVHEYHLQGGENSLQTLFPNIAKDWDYEKNDPLTPNDITPNSTKVYWWICPLCNHHYRESVNAKKNRMWGCPKCTKQLGTSVPEQIIFFYLQQYYPSVINSYKPVWLNEAEIDIFIPELNVGIEYDGLNWHRNIDRDLEKDTIVAKNGITLIRVREKGCPELHSDSIKIYTDNIDQQYQYMNIVLKNLFSTLDDISGRKHEYNINLEEDIFDILALFKTRQKEKSLANSKPELIEEWNYDKNGNLKPQYTNAHSAQKVWWKCKKCGYEWKAAVSSRTSGFGCPHCANEVAWPGQDDLKTLYPLIAAEWNYEKNGNNLPEHFLPNSGKAVWWKCSKCGLEWKMLIGRRVKGSKCPKCYHRKSYNSSPVLNIDTGKIYQSITQASIDIGIGYGSISACCRGKQETAGGYHWEYITPDKQA